MSSHPSWPGLSRPSRLVERRLSGDLLIQVSPCRIGLRDETRLPRARPMLHILLALNRIARGREDLKVDELMDVITLRVPFDEAIAMLVDAANEIARDADIDRTARSAREDIEIILPHHRSLPKRDGRDKPGHDGRERRASRTFAHPTEYVPLFPPRRTACNLHQRALRDCLGKIRLTARVERSLGQHRHRFGQPLRRPAA